MNNNIHEAEMKHMGQKNPISLHKKATTFNDTGRTHYRIGTAQNSHMGIMLNAVLHDQHTKTHVNNTLSDDLNNFKSSHMN